eukprot:6213799-Pleurochrysis_carterae.AAC.12
MERFSPKQSIAPSLVHASYSRPTVFASRSYTREGVFRIFTSHTNRAPMMVAITVAFIGSRKTADIETEPPVLLVVVAACMP